MKAFYKIYDLKKYYPNFVGANPIAVVSDLPEEELLQKFPELQRVTPCAFFTYAAWSGFKKAQRAYQTNEEKFRNRMKFCEENYGYEEGVSELSAANLDDEDIMDTVITRISVEHLREVLRMLSEAQSRRVLLYYSGYTYAEIAEAENISFQVAHRSVKKALKKIINYF
jgi:RNA polymerase sigma factor (sigma-70 family)